jgi:hypothetical protein
MTGLQVMAWPRAFFLAATSTPALRFIQLPVCLILLLLLKALQLQRSFGLPNEFFPFGVVFDAVLPM